MKIEQYEIINISKIGRYYLVPVTETDAEKTPPKTMPPNVKTIGGLVYFHRTAAKLTQRALAKAIGRNDHKHIGEIERGLVKRPRKELINSIAEVFGADFRKNLDKLGDVLRSDCK